MLTANVVGACARYAEGALILAIFSTASSTPITHTEVTAGKFSPFEFPAH